MKLRSPVSVSLLVASAFILSQCETGEERAESHYQSSLELVEKGDPVRALVELRNVFKLAPDHLEARQTFARIELERGKLQSAYGQYLRVVEQQPDNIEGLRVLSRLAFLSQNWEETERHARAAFELAPEDSTILAVNTALDYRQAVLDDDSAGRRSAFDKSMLILASDSENQIARQVVIDQLIVDQKLSSALAELNLALAADPDNIRFHELKLRVLNTLNDVAGVGSHLRAMYDSFPENERVRNSLIAWYVQQGDLTGAEDFLRQLAQKAEGPDADQARTTVVQFLRQSQGADAARAELDRLVEAGENPTLFKGLRAVLDYETGDRERGQADLEALLEGAEPNDQVNGLKVTLAQMLVSAGNNVGARALVEEILETDTTNVPALQMRAQWLIEDDKPSEAISTLRTALDQAPRNPSVLTLMADAHLRDGSRDLAGERLSLAVEASNQAPGESLRYAGFLMQDERYTTAENVLITAMRQSPDNLQLLQTLGQLYLAQGDFSRAEGVVENLERQGSDQARGIANGLRSALLQNQDRTDENVAFLQRLVDNGDAGMTAAAAIVQTHLQQGEVDRATSYLEAELEKTPDHPALLFLRAGVFAVEGNVSEAESLYRDLIKTAPTAQSPVQALYALLRRDGRAEEATAVLEEGIKATNGAPEFLWIRAGELEANGDFDGAIAIYDDLYAKDSSNLIVANNLASLITTHRDDAESLERAFAIARRLRGSDQAAFQDTYGWIAFRRGDLEEALSHLEPAAASLSEDPLVQFHLGMTYAALEDTENARTTLARAIEIAGDTSLPQMTTARETLEGLPAAE